MGSAGRISAASALAVLSLGLAGSPALAATWHVNGANASCSDAGAGSLAQPFCTIGRGAAAALAGDTVSVAAGDYREIVVAPADAVTYTGAAGARVLGTENLSGGAWMPASATAWSIAYDPDTNPRQVWVDDVRLLEVTTGPGDLVPNSFFYDGVADVLTVDIGGANPGLHDVEAGAYSFGFDLVGRTGVVVQGFEVLGQNTNGIRVRTGTNVTVRSNRVHRARSFGILVEGTTAPTVSEGVVVESNELFENGDSGIRLRTGVAHAAVSGNVSHHNRNHGIATSHTSDSWIAGNELFANARPGGVSTTGLLLDDGSHRNQVERNLAYANQDTGFQVNGTAGVVRNVDNAFVRNISHSNGDHGFDIRESDGTLVVSNTAYGNTNDGFSIEGNAAGTSLANNIGVDNGVFTGGNDLFVAVGATGGFTSDYDVWHNTVGTAHEIEFDGVAYDTVAAFHAATGHEQHGSDADPLLANAAAGDFEPGLAGPAIDSANAAAAGFQAPDFFGQAPIDIATVADTGAGAPAFADRGAVERRDAPPSARLGVSPRRAKVGQLVEASGAGSTDDEGIVSYRFDFGDGTVVTQASPVAAHAYAARGNYKVRLTVTDGAGQSDTKLQPVQVK